MTVAKVIKDKSWPIFSFAVGVIGVLSALFTVYAYYHEKKPVVVYEVVNESNVLDIHTSVKDLAILFQGRNIQESNLNLRILTIRVRNSGQADVLQGDYDQDSPWGLKMLGCKIVEARVIDSNTGYLMQAMKLGKPNNDSLYFSKVILEKGKYFVLEMLVLHDKDHYPTSLPIGKIAGVGAIEVQRDLKDAPRRSFLSELFYGSFLVQVARPWAYLAALTVVMLPFIFILILILTARENKAKRTRRISVNALMRMNQIEPGSKAWIAYDLYVEQGLPALKFVESAIEDEARLTNALLLTKLTFRSADLERGMRVASPYAALCMDLIDRGVASYEVGKVEFDSEFREAVHVLLRCLADESYSLPNDQALHIRN